MSPAVDVHPIWASAVELLTDQHRPAAFYALSGALNGEIIYKLGKKTLPSMNGGEQFQSIPSINGEIQSIFSIPPWLFNITMV
jgi:hypothetical protein